MNQPIAIIIAGALIAAAIMVTNHWTLYTAGNDFVSFLRLNRWTGSIVVCGGYPRTQARWEVPCPVSLVPPKAQ
jgi:hypothetical protein